MKNRSLPAGFVCDCGERHLYPTYVFAHWHDKLDFTCPKCKTQYEVFRGRALSEHKLAGNPQLAIMEKE